MRVRLTSHIGQRINRELVVAESLLQSVCPAVAIYGSARIAEDDPYYKQTFEVARALSQAGVSVISGGGPGLMEAANRGAQAGFNGTSVGLNIHLSTEQEPNAYQDISIDFVHFAARKVAFCKHSKAAIAMPGGFGTLDEIFEVLTLMQTRKMPEIPALLYGREFWQGLLDWIRDQQLSRGLIGDDDFHKRLCLVDSPEEVLKALSGVVAQATR